MKFFDFKGFVGKAWAGGGNHVITGNLNQPIKFNVTKMEDKMYDNQLANERTEDIGSEPVIVDNSQQITNKILNKPDLKFVSNPMTWQQMSPKKEKKSSSSSGSSECSSSGESQNSGLKTWATVKKNSVENMDLKSTSNSGHSSSSSSSSTGNSPTRTWSSIRQEANKNNSVNWKDTSPTKTCDSQDDDVILKNVQNGDDFDTKSTLDDNSGLDNFSFSSKGSPSTSDRKIIRKTDSNDCDNSSSSLPLGVTSQEEGLNNDYFYDEDFTVQFDTNLRESSPAVTCSIVDPSGAMDFPNMVTGSYLSFKNVKSSGIVNHDVNELFCPDESEISCSRHSNMDVSTSEREMMCSSDMLDFSDNPLFTPPLSGDVHMVSQEDSTDSLDKVNKDKGQLDLSGSHTSSDGNLNLDCFPRKEEYFLSFDGSQGHTESYSEQSNSLNSNCSSQGQTSCNPNHVNVCSSEDFGDESSESFHICMAGNAFHKKPQVGSRLAKFQTLTALQEQASELSASSQFSDEKPCSEPVSSPTKKTFRKLSPTKGRQLRFAQKMCFACHLNNSCGESHSSPSRSRSRQKTVTSWKQVKSLKKLGKLDNILDPSRSRSMPDICLHTWQSGSSLSCHGHDIQKIAESFHCKRHSAYLLDLYQRVKNQSNPVSPECMANIEQILFHNVVCKEQKLGNSSHHCEFCHGDSSSNTMVNSQPVLNKEGKLGYYTHKRILDWLDKDKLENRRDKSCQTASFTKTKDTDISPTTVTLWCGTRNFGSQFPPSAKDCAIQTAVHELMDNTQDCAQQTTPTLEGKPLITESVKKDRILGPSKSLKKEDSLTSLDKNDILKLISHDFKEIDNLLPRHDFLKSKSGPIPRSKSADSATRRKIPLLGRQSKSLFYSHKSLPDLSFIELKHLEEKLDDGSTISLFDPLPIAMPVPVLIPTVIDTNRVTKSLSSKNSFDNLSHCCRSNSKCRGKGHRSQSAPARSHNSNLNRNCAESGSSSSGFTSSTSSGIDPGYSDRCVHNSSPSNDIERLIFYPPHVENTYKGEYINDNLSDSGNTSLPQKPEKLRQPWKSAKSADKKVKRYTNEIHPINTEAKGKNVSSPNSNTSHSSSNSSLHLERLYALQEEQTPVSSPEREMCHHENDYLYGNAFCVNCCQGREQGHVVQGWENEEVVVRRRKFDYHIQLSSESGSSGSGSFFPNFDKKPLKSCLRKRQFLRSRSLSDPNDLGQQLEQTKDDRKKNRHSYACEEIILIQDDAGEYFLCKNEEDESEPVLFYVEEEKEEVEDKTTVNLRQKNDQKESELDAAEKELNGKRKSVSFASEVSFHAISPHMSPKRQQNSDSEQEVMSSGEHDGLLLNEQVTRSSEEKASTGQKDDKHSSDSDDAPPSEFQLSPTGELTPTSDLQEITTSNEKDQRKVLLSDISSAAESLVEHFASAKNPFDKLRLGSSADTPVIGDLVLSRLCPAICHVINDGLKSHLTGVQVFGRVQITAWKLAEASVEQGPYTRAIHDLVQQIKGHTGLVSHSNKFDAFIFGLLNLRLLDYWMGYLRHNSTIVEKYYNPDSVMALSGTLYERKYSDILISLQPLAVLPFQLSIEFITSRLSMQGSVSTSFAKDGSPKKDNSSSPKKDIIDQCVTESFSKEKAIIGVAASKAWDWLKNGASSKSPIDEVPSPPIITGNVMISSLTGILGKLSGTAKVDSRKVHGSEREISKEETKYSENGERPIFAVGLVNNLPADTPPAKPPRTGMTLALPSCENEAMAVDVTEELKDNPRNINGDMSIKSLPTGENSMLSSFSGMAQKLLGINPLNTESSNKKTENDEILDGKAEPFEMETNDLKDSKPLVVRRVKMEAADTDTEKNRSGLIRLFDKLLLPRDSSKKEQKLKSRWSWGYGQGQQVKVDSIATKNVPTKNDAKLSSQPLQSKVPCYTPSAKVGGVQSRSSIATVPAKLVCRQPVKTVVNSTESNSPKSSVLLQDKTKDNSVKMSKDRPQIKSKVPVRKVKGQTGLKEKPKPLDVPKETENKWQGGITLSASLEEGPTLKAPPSVTNKVISQNDKHSVDKDQQNVAVPKRKLDCDTIASRGTYQDAFITDGCENTLHLSDEINCNSPNVKTDIEGHTRTADTGFRQPNFRFVQTTISSDKSEGQFSYKTGDHFEVLAQLDSDWLYCINGKREGLIRLEHVQPLKDDYKELHSEFYS